MKNLTQVQADRIIKVIEADASARFTLFRGPHACVIGGLFDAAGFDRNTIKNVDYKGNQHFGEAKWATYAAQIQVGPEYGLDMDQMGYLVVDNDETVTKKARHNRLIRRVQSWVQDDE